MTKYCLAHSGQLKTALFLLFLFFFSALSQLGAQAVQVVEVRDTTSFMGASISRVYYINEHTVYQAQEQFTNSVSKPRFDSATQETVYDDSITATGKRNRYFVFHRDSSHGCVFSTHQSYRVWWRRVDEESKAVGGSNEMHKMLPLQADNIWFSADSSERTQVYRFAAKPDTPAYRIVFTASEKLNHLAFSLNPSIDKEWKMKLRRIEFVASPFRHRPSGTDVPEMRLVLEMRELPTDIPEEVRYFLNWYKDLMQSPLNSQ